MKNELLVKDIMLKIGEFPIVNEDELFRESIEEMNKYGLGITCIVNSKYERIEPASSSHILV